LPTSWRLCRILWKSHEYFGVDPKILWETLKNELPLIVIGLKGILADSQVM
jgi:uncharacterized protein with HEPN domain